MSKFTLSYSVDLRNPSGVVPINQPWFRGDAKAHTLRIAVTQDGIGADLSGCSATCLIGGANSATVAGSISDNIVSVTMPSAAYMAVGRNNILVRLTDSNSGVCTIFAGTVMVD